jgi:hypothetical protein
MKTLLFLMKNHTLGVPRVTPYHSPVAKSANYHHMRTRHKRSQQGAALPLISRKSLLGCMRNSYGSHVGTPSLDYFLRSSTSDPRNPSMFMPRDIPGVDIAGILKRAALMPLELTRAEASRAVETPGIGWATFNDLLGGNRKSEWPQCSRFPGYSDLLCVDVVVQPFTPQAAGKPGLLLRPPTVIETPETEGRLIHILSNTLQSNALYYRGKYTRVPIPASEIQFSWSDLPYEVRIPNCYSSDKGL